MREWLREIPGSLWYELHYKWSWRDFTTEYIALVGAILLVLVWWWKKVSNN